jgi:hypothetical protein
MKKSEEKLTSRVEEAVKNVEEVATSSRLIYTPRQRRRAIEAPISGSSGGLGTQFRGIARRYGQQFGLMRRFGLLRICFPAFLICKAYI